MATNRIHDNPSVRQRFGSDVEVSRLTGISRRTLQSDRAKGRQRFPWYRSGGKILYDLDEVTRLIRAGVVKTKAGGAKATAINGPPIR